MDERSNLLQKSITYGRKKSYNIDPRWKYHKTFYVSKLINFLDKLEWLFRDMPFSLVSIFAGNARSLSHSGAPKRCSGSLLDLPTNIRLGLKEINILPYYYH
jgi:hypothetical protein